MFMMGSGFLSIVIFTIIFGINWSEVEGIGGKNGQEISEYPYLAGILSDNQFVCHAIAFNSTHLVSRASCIPGADDPTKYSNLKIHRQVYFFADFNQSTKGNSEITNVQSITIYNKENSCSNNDMVIIKVDPAFKKYDGVQGKNVRRTTFGFTKSPKGDGFIVSYGQNTVEDGKMVPLNTDRKLILLDVKIDAPGVNPNPKAIISNTDVYQAHQKVGKGSGDGFVCPLDDAAPVYNMNGALVGLVIAKPDECYKEPVMIFNIGKYACWFHTGQTAFTSCEAAPKTDVYCKSGRFSPSDFTILAILSSILIRQLFFN